jgi:hypothetical protein
MSLQQSQKHLVTNSIISLNKFGSNTVEIEFSQTFTLF